MIEPPRHVDGALSFVPMNEGHLPLLIVWRSRNHVAEWFHGALTAAETEAKYLPRIRGAEPVDGFVVLLDGVAIGYIQRQLVASDPEQQAAIDMPGDPHSIDVFIGEAELLGRGLGTRIVREFTDLMLADPAVDYVVIDPDTENAAAIRAYEKAGFTRVKVTRDTLDATRSNVLMERRRTGTPAVW